MKTMKSITTRLENCLAPAKINRFLHVIGRRADGFHLLQSVFQLIDWCDTLHFELSNHAEITRSPHIENIPPDQDLCVRAARLLQQATGCTRGVHIHLEKQLPMGGGLGGGSSDAATTLLALNHLWQLQLSRRQLQQLALQLGADVPFFLVGTHAFAEGIGEKLTPLPLPACRFLLVIPPVAVPTPIIFTAPELTRDTQPVKIADFSGTPMDGAVNSTLNSTPSYLANFGKNDLQPVAASRFPKVAEALQALHNVMQTLQMQLKSIETAAYTAELEIRMSGSGSTVYAVIPEQWSTAQAEQAVNQCSAKLGTSFACRLVNSIAQHPVPSFWSAHH